MNWKKAAKIYKAQRDFSDRSIKQIIDGKERIISVLEENIRKLKSKS